MSSSSSESLSESCSDSEGVRSDSDDVQERFLGFFFPFDRDLNLGLDFDLDTGLEGDLRLCLTGTVVAAIVGIYHQLYSPLHLG